MATFSIHVLKPHRELHKEIELLTAWAIILQDITHKKLRTVYTTGVQSLTAKG